MGKIFLIFHDQIQKLSFYLLYLLEISFIFASSFRYRMTVNNTEEENVKIIILNILDITKHDVVIAK